MSTAVTITEDTVDDAKNLVWSRVMPVSDLRLEDVSYDVDSAVAGENVPVTLTVTNAGDHAVTSFDIYVDGNLLEPQTCDFALGQSMEATITLTCPDQSTDYEIEVIESGKEDYYSYDNVQTLTMGYADAVVDLEYHQIGTQKALVATVTNEGIAPASGSLLFYDKNGTVVAESTFTDLASGDVAVAQYEFDADAENIIEGDVSVVAETDQEEYYTFNNEASLFVSKPWQPTAVQTVTISGESVTVEVFCNEEDPGTMACCAFYSDKGQMLKAETAELTADKKTILTYDIPNGAKLVKWFVMDADGRPACESVEKGV